MSDNVATDNSNNIAGTLTSNQWMINIGGIASNGNTTGVQVPVSVVIFEVAGIMIAQGMTEVECSQQN